MAFLFSLLLIQVSFAGKPIDCSDLLNSSIQDFHGFVRVSSGRDIFVQVEIPKGAQFKQPVFMVHGLLDSQKRFDKMAKLLLKKGHPILRMDVYGFGRSLVHELDRNNRDLRFLKSLPYETNVQDIADILSWQKKRFQFGKVLALGHSMGGGLLGALAASSKASDFMDRVVLVSPYIYRLDRYQLENQMLNPWIEKIFGRGPGRIQSFWIDQYLSLNDPLVDLMFLNSYLSQRFSEHLDELSHDEIIQSKGWNDQLKEALVVSAVSTVKGLRDLDLQTLVPHFSRALKVDLVIANQDELVPPSFQKKFGSKLESRTVINGKESEILVLEGSHMLPSELDEELADFLGT